MELKAVTKIWVMDGPTLPPRQYLMINWAVTIYSRMYKGSMKFLRDSNVHTKHHN